MRRVVKLREASRAVRATRLRDLWRELERVANAGVPYIDVEFRSWEWDRVFQVGSPLRQWAVPLNRRRRVVTISKRRHLTLAEGCRAGAGVFNVSAIGFGPWYAIVQTLNVRVEAPTEIYAALGWSRVS